MCVKLDISLSIENKTFPKICLTFDAEEWSLPGEYNLKTIYNQNTEFSKIGCIKLCNLLKQYKIKATFFVTGYFAEKEPEVVKMLFAEGHEIASHAYTNNKLTQYNKTQLKSIICKTTEILSELVPESIKGFRAPMCCINNDIIDVLYALGFEYDSSLHPTIIPGRYCRVQYPSTPHFLRNEGFLKNENRPKILEIPISVIPLIRFPISWWWMRNMGNWITRFGTDINLRNSNNVVLYFHPWEYVSLPKIKGLPGHLTRKCGANFLIKLENFINIYINRYEFSCLRELSKGYLLDV